MRENGGREKGREGEKVRGRRGELPLLTKRKMRTILFLLQSAYITQHGIIFRANGALPGLGKLLCLEDRASRQPHPLPFPDCGQSL